MARQTLKVVTLRKRAEFQLVRGGGRATAIGFVLEGKRRAAPAASPPVDGPRFGFTITRKIGNAVTRNRIRRRLRAALCQTAQHADAGSDYVVVAREPAAVQEFKSLVADLKRALERVQIGIISPSRAPVNRNGVKHK